MEKLVINVPDAKSNIVKQILHGLGVDIPGQKAVVKGNYKEKLLKVSKWSDDDIKGLRESLISFSNLRSDEW